MKGRGRAKKKRNDPYMFEEPVQRICLKCNKEFTAYGKGNRVCDHCNKGNKVYGSFAHVTPINTDPCVMTNDGRKIKPGFNPT